MKSIFLSILVLFSLSGFASHISVSGTLGTDTYWIEVDTVRLTGDLTINEGVTLLIGPGTVVEAQGIYGFEVFGTIKAIGTATDSIKFTCADKNTGWVGFYFFDNQVSNNDSSLLKYCIFEYGGIPNPYNGKSATIFVQDSNKLNITHCLFINSESTAIDLNSTNIIVSENTFRNNNSYCIIIYHSGSMVAHVTNNKFFNNYSVIYLGPNNNSFVNNNLIMGNNGGIYCYGCSSIISNNTIVNNTNKGIDFWGGQRLNTIAL